jgi:hypothetical protein
VYVDLLGSYRDRAVKISRRQDLGDYQFIHDGPSYRAAPIKVNLVCGHQCKLRVKPV